MDLARLLLAIPRRALDYPEGRSEGRLSVLRSPSHKAVLARSTKRSVGRMNRWVCSMR